MASVRLHRVCKSFGEVQVVKNVDLEIADGEFLVLVGPSGCGKTTTLRMVAGLERATAGDIEIDGRRVNDVAPAKRDIAMVFQNFALYPHMTVRQNMRFGLEGRKLPEKAIAERVATAAEMLELHPYLDRKPGELSGGQKQRVSLGRAIVREPGVLLMDEPLSNLDARLRVQMREEIKRLCRTLGTTTIYVTHDQVEAMTLGDRIVVMNHGVVQQVDPPSAVYGRPANTFVAEITGSPSMNLVPGRLERSGERTELVVNGYRVPLDGVAETAAGLVGLEGRVLAGVRPEAVHVAAARSGANGGAGCVELVEPHGPDTILALRWGASMLSARVEPQAVFAEGDAVEISFRPGGTRVYDAETGWLIA